MKASSKAFWLLIFIIGLVALVTIASLIWPDQNNAKTLASFFDIMKYALTLVGGGYLGVQIGEKQPVGEN